MDNAGPDRAILISLVVVIYRGEKSWGVYSFTGQGLFLKKPNDVCNQTFRLALEYVETVNPEYRPSLSLLDG